jgi:hypothetical protein
MSTTVVERLTWYILGLGLVATIVASALHGRVAGQSTAAGVALALANWYAMRFLLRRIMSGSMRSKTLFAGLLMVKMGVLMAAVFACLHTGLFEPVAFTVGVSCLVVGTLFGSFVQVLSASPAKGAS